MQVPPWEPWISLTGLREERLYQPVQTWLTTTSLSHAVASAGRWRREGRGGGSIIRKRADAHFLLWHISKSNNRSWGQRIWLCWMLFSFRDYIDQHRSINLLMFRWIMAKCCPDTSALTRFSQQKAVVYNGALGTYVYTDLLHLHVLM